MNRLAALVEQQKSEQASGKGKEIHNENEALKALQDLLNKANISLDLQGGVDNLQQNFDQIAKITILLLLSSCMEKSCSRLR